MTASTEVYLYAAVVSEERNSSAMMIYNHKEMLLEVLISRLEILNYCLNEVKHYSIDLVLAFTI